MVRTERLVNMMQPETPLTAVYYDDDGAGFDSVPVIALACWELTQDGMSSIEIRPVLLVDGELVEEDKDCVNYFGLSDKQEIDVLFWLAKAKDRRGGCRA